MSTLSSEQAFNVLVNVLMAIPDDQVFYCNMPLEVATAEATQLAIVAVADREQLLGTGIDAEWIDTLSLRAAAFYYAAALYQSVLKQDPDAIQAWKEGSTEGYALRAELIRIMTFAFRKDKELTARLSGIKEGRGDKDMIMDLLALSILGKNASAILNDMPMFDQTQIEAAETLSQRLSNIYAKATIDPKEVNRTKVQLDRAYTYYKQAADEVKAAGQFVFEGTDRYQSYISDWHQQIRRKSNKSVPEVEPAAV